MFKNPFREPPTHDKYAELSLRAKLELLKALENTEYYEAVAAFNEAVVAFKRKQIARLEGEKSAKTSESYNSNSLADINNPDLQDSSTPTNIV